MYGEIRNSSATISDVFKDKNPITFDYRMDPKGFFTIISESKDREIIVGRRKIRLKNNTKEKVDLRSATMVSFAKGKYFVQYKRLNNPQSEFFLPSLFLRPLK